jgi:hypothetical protein
MRENFMSGIEEGRLDKLKSEACLLLYFVTRAISNKDHGVLSMSL